MVNILHLKVSQLFPKFYFKKGKQRDPSEEDSGVVNFVYFSIFLSVNDQYYQIQLFPRDQIIFHPMNLN